MRMTYPGRLFQKNEGYRLAMETIYLRYFLEILSLS